MDSVKFMGDAEITLANGDIIKGQITTIDDVTYRFFNDEINLNVYLSNRNTDNRWHQCGGAIEFSQFIIDQLGHDLDICILKLYFP